MAFINWRSHVAEQVRGPLTARPLMFCIMPGGPDAQPSCGNPDPPPDLGTPSVLGRVPVPTNPNPTNAPVLVSTRRNVFNQYTVDFKF